MILLALKRKQSLIREQYRTCHADVLIKYQALDAFIDELLSEDFSTFIVETYDEIHARGTQ